MQDADEIGAGTKLLASWMLGRAIAAYGVYSEDVHGQG